MKDEALKQKLRDMDIPGYVVQFEPEEADSLGFTVDDAINYADAIEASNDIEKEDN